MNKFAYDLPKDLYKGMRIKPSMDMIANTIEKDPFRIKYPDRGATFYLNSPQFLSLIQDNSVGLAEQSKNLAKRQLAQAMAQAEGRGGVFDMAVDDAVSTTGDDEYEKRAQDEADKMQEQERTRKLREEYEREQLEAEEKTRIRE